MESMKILLCCGMGMSSGFLATNARKYAKMKKLPLTIEARSHSEVNEFLNSIDLLMLGPHYKTELKHYENLAKPYGVKVAVIPQSIYGRMDGEGLIKLAKEILNKE